MSRIINLRIKNYRCFKDFTAHFEERFIVLIGRGDSGKSSLLKAIEALLSPLWNYSFSDWDFYNGDIEAPIQIEADIADLPEELLMPVANALGVTVEELTGESEQKEKPTPSEESELNAHAKAILYKYEQLNPAQRVMFEKMLDAALEAAKGDKNEKGSISGCYQSFCERIRTKSSCRFGRSS